MPQQSIFRWRSGRGWLVFAGNGDPNTPNNEVRGTALGRMAADGGAACIAISGDSTLADYLLDDLEDLGAPSGYVVDLAAETDEAVQAKIGEASLVVLITDESPSSVRSNLVGAAMAGLETAFANGAVVLFEGACAAAFGTYILDGYSQQDGLGWLEDAVVLTGLDEDIAPAAAPVLAAHEEAIAIGIGSESALALGPDGEIEIWGKRRVTVALGAQYKGA